MRQGQQLLQQAGIAPCRTESPFGCAGSPDGGQVCGRTRRDRRRFEGRRARSQHPRHRRRRRALGDALVRGRFSPTGRAVDLRYRRRWHLGHEGFVLGFGGRLVGSMPVLVAVRGGCRKRLLEQDGEQLGQDLLGNLAQHVFVPGAHGCLTDRLPGADTRGFMLPLPVQRRQARRQRRLRRRVRPPPRRSGTPGRWRRSCGSRRP